MVFFFNFLRQLSFVFDSHRRARNRVSTWGGAARPAEDVPPEKTDELSTRVRAHGATD